MSENIHTAINAVMKEVGYVQKSRSGGLNYSFAGEAALIAALRPAMVEQNIYCFVMDVRDVETREYTTGNGKPMVNVSLTANVCFTHAPSATSVIVTARGEGSDSGDKANNKAMTGAYKYALRQTFLIETGDDPDDNHEERGSQSTHTPAQRTTVSQARVTPPPAAKLQATAEPAAAATPAVSPQPATSAPANSNGKKPRPLAPADLKDIITRKAETLKGRKISDMQKRDLSKGIEEFFATPDANARCKQIEKWLTGFDSLSDMPANVAIALYEWAKPRVADGAYQIDADTGKELELLWKQVDSESVPF